MSTFAFSNASSGNASLYLIPADNGWGAFVLAKNTSANPSLTLAETAVLNGFYLFAGAGPTIAADTLVQNVWNYMAGITQPFPPSNAVLWLLQPNDTLADSNVTGLFLIQQGGGFSVLRQLNFHFGNNYASLFINNQNVNIKIDDVNNRLQLSGPDQSQAIALRADQLNSNTRVQPPPLDIPFTGPGMGCMRFVIGLNNATDFTAFDNAIKYFYPDKKTLQLVMQNYPLFPNGNLNDFVLCQASIYPPDLLNTTGTVTYLALIGQTLNSSTQKQSPTLLHAFFTTDYGYPLMLQPFVSLETINGGANYPAAGSALLVFTQRTATVPGAVWYMSPAGQYTLVIDAAYAEYRNSAGQMRLLCGLAGTEAISFTPQVSGATGDCISFFPNHAAYVLQFPVAPAGNTAGGGQVRPLLDNTYLTAWAGIVQGSSNNAPVVYHAQPQGAALFAAGQDVFASDKQLLGYLTPDAGILSDISPAVCFPLAAYSNGAAVTEAAAFEAEILSPARKTVIGAAAQTQLRKLHGRNSQNIIPSTSPQGFYTEIDQTTGIWTLLQLASNQFLENDGQMSPIYRMAFKNLPVTLQTAFQSNQLFLVISYNPLKDGVPVLGDFENEMYIEGWPFILRVPEKNTFGQYNNVIIFKFRSGTLLDNVQNPQLWTMPEEFNNTADNGIPNIGMWLQQYVQDGIDQYLVNHDEDYYKFYSIATDPMWQGVISLGVDIDLQEFPADLQGLLAGIDLARFKAHHFGIDMNVVKNDAGVLSMLPNSSLFGLIDYKDALFASMGSNVTTYEQQVPINQSVDYTFVVLLLKIAFTNSKIRNFNSYIALTANRLFGDVVNSSNRQNLLVLQGAYENHDGIPSYTFNAGGDHLLYMDSNIVQDVEILKSSFSTSSPQQGGQNVSAVFSFWGFLNFFELQGFDLFSFGNETGSTPNNYGISFSNMYLHLSFPLDSPTTQTYTFDVGQIAFDIGQSTARGDSLYRHFPLQLTGMATGNKDNTPDKQGYLSVLLPSLQQQQGISDNWYGLLFSLNMGTPGALASAAGFNTTFMAGWDAGATGASAAMKLPGVNPQAPSFSLQGVLKLDIGTITLSLATGSGPGNMQYLMRINKIVLKLLSLSFPSNANIGFFLFGNPDEQAPPESLGWYAAYAAK